MLRRPKHSTIEVVAPKEEEEENITFLYMFRALNVHPQEVTLYTCSIWYLHFENK
jgi:hypothetical protein